ncbi:hypothetical protein [Microbulbifer halophilus]|uniref:Big-1 domain-containing protein n=1 Tax=Microbulbifer halophilus TaxID=453963 RepID=A0ABW5EFS6_9GAMM|nr:hypothetical protein [Microbulbifer halophilus]MCW8127600.1 hypothetical protein [Microbulbifer halophilus]
MDNNVKIFELPDRYIPGAIAVEHDCLWLLNRSAISYTNTRGRKIRHGEIYRERVHGRGYGSMPLPETPEGREESHPQAIALQTNDDNALSYVWVSDYGAGYVYCLDPEDLGSAEKNLTFDLGEKSRPTGIAWDNWRKFIWVADEAGRLVAIDTNPLGILDELTVSRPGSKIIQVAVVEEGVWFTEAGTGKVCFHCMDQMEEITELALTPENPVSSSPFGLATCDGRLWITEYRRRELWVIDDITIATVAPEEMKPRKVASFDKGYWPTDIIVDAAGYLWVNLDGGGNTFSTVVQFTDTGDFVKRYDLGRNNHPLGGIAYDVIWDKIWISDAEPNHRYLALTPIDQIKPARNGNVRIATSPKAGAALQGELFPEFTVAVTENEKPVERHITLTVEPSDKALFRDSSNQSCLTVKTDATTGKAVVKTLQVKAGAAKGEIAVKATTRGFSPKQVETIFTGTIGEISITASSKAGKAVPGELFHEFSITVTGDGKPLAGRDVTLSIEPSSKASFEGNKSSITVPTGKDGTVIVNMLRAAMDATAGDTFTIEATTIGFEEPVTIFTGTVGEISITAVPKTGRAAPGELFDAFTVITMGAERPVERQVTLSIEPSGKASFEGNKNSITVQTGKDGKADITTLRAAADAIKDDTITITARAGHKDPGPVYIGVIGDRHIANITGITPIKDEEETVAFGTDFKNLEAQVEGAGSAHAEVVFRIDAGAEHAAFRQGQAGATEYTTQAGSDGIARAGLYALEKAGDVTVSVYPKTLGAAAKKTFKIRHIVPLPDKIQASEAMGIYVGQPSHYFPLKVLAGSTPVPNVVVQVIVRSVGSEAQGVHFGEKGKPDDPTVKEVRLRTDRNGQAAIGAGAEYFITSPKPGHVDIRFAVIQPAGATKAAWDITANVEREMVV